MSEPRHVAHDYAGMVEAMRAIKAHLGLSNELVDTLNGWTAGYWDKVFGPSSMRGLSIDTFNEALWVLAARIEISIDPDRLREMEQHYEQRCAAQAREKPNRISRKIMQTAAPSIMRHFGSIGGKVRAHKLSDAKRYASAKKAACARWRKRRKRRKPSALDKPRDAVRCSRARLRQHASRND